MNKEQQVEKLKEGLTKALYDHIAAVNKGILSCEELGSILLSTVLAPLLIDTGEPENQYPPLSGDHDAESVDNQLEMNLAFSAGAKAARAKFVAVGEIMK